MKKQITATLATAGRGFITQRVAQSVVLLTRTVKRPAFVVL